MKKKLLLALWPCLLHAPVLFAQYFSNTETSISIPNYPFPMGCMSYMPSGNYQVYVEYYDYDNATMTRAPATGYYSCQLFNSYQSVDIYIPAATLPTVNTTVWMYDLSYTTGKLVLVHASTNTTTERDFDNGYVLCPPLARTPDFNVPLFYPRLNN